MPLMFDEQETKFWLSRKQVASLWSECWFKIALDVFCGNQIDLCKNFEFYVQTKVSVETWPV